MPKIPEDDGAARQVYIAVRVDLNAAGEAICAKVDCEGAPWPYCGDWTDANGQVYDVESEDWLDGTEDEIAGAEQFVSALFAKGASR